MQRVGQLPRSEDWQGAAQLLQEVLKARVTSRDLAVTEAAQAVQCRGDDNTPVELWHKPEDLICLCAGDEGLLELPLPLPGHLARRASLVGSGGSGISPQSTTLLSQPPSACCREAVAGLRS